MPRPMWCRAWEIPGVVRRDANGDIMCEAGRDSAGDVNEDMLWIP